ncbi:MAG TPA: hypothetical protein PKO06_13675 [Candidatus Ozemobacteraceae bacterium]|nr:hypothetical protein [Candidatus Ozemobacteraceae bacterium]
MRHTREYQLAIWGLIVLFLASGAAAFALDARYSRNGECYLLLGDSGTHQGVYRLNNPAADAIFVGRLYNPGTSIGISVDLNRNCYTFSEIVEPSYSTLSGNIPRQVVDGTVSVNSCNWGYHAYEHYDHRGSGQTTRPIYRTPGASHSIGPGTPITAPLGNPLPPGDTVFAGK